ncbi:carotenoid oxygenase family protein [Streptomyces pseudovenezuelae]|uniref:Dioxygenase n=1 Tax=Streptomyces pseudovenezuelae TaxID=67350 RepID=A0ABT6LTJ1_9ACTN|nr:carotenoid oxygenase family protein [Streptomyces pseudovenezuelae]MDH6219616.1 carotenoid cleavage dioxygenase-like enzyme [Streptomyces pseudovenezuelae]
MTNPPVPVVTTTPMNISSQAQPVSPDQDWPTDNKFLRGPFAPWTQESSGYDLPVEGVIPEDLAGAMFRTSSNPRFQPRNMERYHWWDGDAMIAGLYLRDGKAAYRTSWVATDSMKFEVEQGEAVYGSFVNGGTAGRLPKGAPRGKNNPQTNAGIFDDHLLVYFEGALPTAMHPQTLETYGSYDFHGGVDILCTAHFKMDPATGDMLFFAATGPIITWYRADAKTGNIIDSHVIDVGIPVLMHDFAVSENYAIFFVAPNMFRLDLAAQGRPGVVWDESALPHGTQIVLMDRRTHEVKWYEAGGMFAPTHFYNAYEIGDEVVIDLSRISRLGTPADRRTPLSSHEWFPPGYSWQWRIDTATGKVGDRRISGIAGEFPKINDDYVGKQHRYGYFATTRDLATDTMTDGLARHDYLKDSTVVLEGPDPLTSPSEPVFVPRRDARAEDDGYLLSVWWNRDTGLSELLIHEASDLVTRPLARVKLPVRVPLGFHGSWADQAVLDKSIATLRDAD